MSCVLRINPNQVFRSLNPIVLGMRVLSGQLKLGATLTSRNTLAVLGKVVVIEKDKENVESVTPSSGEFAVKVVWETTDTNTPPPELGVHFFLTDFIVSS